MKLKTTSFILFLLVSLNVFAQEHTDSILPIADETAIMPINKPNNSASADSLWDETLGKAALQLKHNRNSKRFVKKETKSEDVIFLEQWHKKCALRDSIFPIESIVVKPNIMYIPLVFRSILPVAPLHIADTTKLVSYPPKPRPASLNTDSEWLDNVLAQKHISDYMMYRAIGSNPQSIQYIYSELPDAPEPFIKTGHKPKKLNVDDKPLPKADLAVKEEVKYKNWLHSFGGSVQFSQAYISDNWYQGGNSNINLLANVEWNVKLNQKFHPNVLFENNIQYKISVNSAPDDSIRSYNITEDMFQLNTKVGYKAIKHWYYTGTLYLKTQLFNNYVSNTNDLSASLMAPGEVNLGIGVTYTTENAKHGFSLSMSVSPLSYNLKTCLKDNDALRTASGVDPGKYTKSLFGSSLDTTMKWQIRANIDLTTKIFAFTDYSKVQVDLENTLNFSINKYLSSKIYAHLRWDDSTSYYKKWGYLQFKELLSFGFNYKFSMS